MKKLLMLTLAILLLPTIALASDYNYISQDDMNTRLGKMEKIAIVDICPVAQFAKGHLSGSMETNAYPVKTEEEREKLHTVLPQLKASGEDIVIVCPGGKGGAKRTYDYYKAQGIHENRLFILEKGMNGWPYETVAK